MKEKFLQFFTGKLSKSIYIAVASAVVCGVAVITTVVIVHNNNQRLDTALESLNEQTATLAQTESATEGVSVTEGNDTTAPTQAANNEPAGDRALQYLAEYDRITAEYEKKRAELVAQTAVTRVALTASSSNLREPQSRAQFWNETSEEYAAYLKEYEKELQQYEASSRAEEESRRRAEEEAKMKTAEEQARVENVQKQINALDAQYEKDVAALKAQYGIS